MNFKVTRVSYGGFAPTVTALLGGEVDSATVAIPDTIEHHKSRQAEDPRRVGNRAPLTSRPTSRPSRSRALM